MAIGYHIYKNDLAGGPVDYGTILATTSSLTYATAAIPTGSDATFAVRAYDTVSGLEESNVDAAVRILTDPAGLDITARPNAVSGPAVRASAGGGLTVSWTYAPGGRAAAPTGFKVYVTTPTISYATPAVTVAYHPSRPDYAAPIAGLSDGVAYKVAIRSYNATADDGGTVVLDFVADATGPSPVESLTATATP